MSRFTKVGGVVDAANRYSSRSRAATRSTECSNASTSRFATIAEILSDTYVTSDRAIRSRSNADRAAASPSPRIASPSTFTLSRNPAAVRRRTWAANAGSSAGSTTPAASASTRRRTSGITRCGNRVASVAPTLSAIRSRCPRPGTAP
ncbi:MAG: hypothetical protein R2713_05485 [Ilumatobacteraceae bacterium]